VKQTENYFIILNDDVIHITNLESSSKLI